MAGRPLPREQRLRRPQRRAALGGAGTPPPAAVAGRRRAAGGDRGGGPPVSGGELLARRRRLLGPAYRHFYEDPVEIVRGEGVHLFDAAGNEYLDAYNNVPCVGHAHPRVVAAIADQAGRLNTHTRYLAAPILDYAERLLATLGGGLGHLMFTCSGSEATDLALRIARFQSGRRGVVVTANAYHGLTTAASEVSPSLGPAVAPGEAVRTIAAPAPGAADPEREGERMAAELAVAVAELEAAGHGFAAFLADSIFSSDGVVPDPAGFLRPLAAAVAAHGGLYVADEVQAGFARTGEAMWGFQRHGIEPDLVTMGKPMGNGMPIAAVAARAELVEEFGRTIRYFNTFGGNSVSIVAATAVLDVIEDEGLLANAAATGAQLLAALTELEGRHPLLRHARGAGLFTGVDVAAAGKPTAGADSAALADAIVNGLRRHRVLIAATGPRGDVLKIRPPLPFAAADVDRLAGALDDVLAALPA
ncbi:MAG: aminotransferase class III-fold pyridoxal phosphate-dependent enzyme [Actinobacteria bacterium]|nr:aminotransferase class III-fold pyridoxal phosphate-dependent enzyme [Actinomycetota bacterium]